MDLDASEDESGIGMALRDYALHDAAEAGDEAIVEDILANAARDTEFDPEALPGGEGSDEVDIDELDDNECSPLHVALLKGHIEVAEVLLRRGANVRQSCEGSPPLVIAVCTAALAHRKDRAQAAVKLLLGHGAVPTQRDDNGATAFHWAAVLGLPDVMNMLISAAEAHNAQQAADFRVAAAAAAASGAPTASHEPPPSIYSLQDKQGNTALHLASGAPHTDSFSLLLGTQEGRKVASVTNKVNQTPLHVAAAHGRAWAVQQLLLLSPQAARSSDKYGRTPLQWATACGSQVVAEVFQRHAGGLDLSNLDLRAQQDGGLPPTLVVAPPACREHRTAPEPLARGADIPPENVRRLHVLTDAEEGILRSSEFAHLQWDERDRLAPLSDILRVHEWNYVRKIQRVCGALEDDPAIVGNLDADTALSRHTWHAALAGVGACCHAIDCVVNGTARNAFCAIRPPGHHAGPLGSVPSANDPHGSMGFCFFNNIAVAGAYAVSVYRHQGVRRVALLDFDVHHGNGTQACIARVVPHTVQYPLHTPLSDGHMRFPAFHPWVDETDKDNILFASVQGYGRRSPLESHFYPGSGATCDTRVPPTTAPAAETSSLGPLATTSDSNFGEVPPEDPDLEFATVEGEHPSTCGPRVVNVGIPGPGSEVAMWRRAWRDKILPAVAAFKPDLIILSAGFDAHKKDVLNNHFIGVTERDYYWLTQQLVSLANTVCKGRLVSALEGGYRIQGGVVSAFARSVAAHVRALSVYNGQMWSHEEAKRQRALELQRRREVISTKRANAARAAERAEKERAELERVLADKAAKETLNAVGEDRAQEANALVQQAPRDATATENPEDGNDRKKRRRRGQVDYAALNLKMEEEAHAARKEDQSASLKHLRGANVSSSGAMNGA